MKKTVKLISIALMCVMMLTCFFFANVFYAMAQAPTTLKAIEGASVLVGGGDKDSGIKFELTISKEDYTNLVNANLGKEIWLGVVIGRAGMGELTEENCLQPGGVIDVKKTNTLKSKDADTLYFDFALTYNEDAIYGELLEQDKISGEEDANWNNFLNFMYSDELLVRPFYKVVGEDGYQIGYGQAGVARSMIHVANAEAESGITPEGFLDKYAVSKTPAGEEVEITVGVDGSIVGEVNENIINYTANTSAKVISRDRAEITDTDFLATLGHGETFRLFGFTASREIYVYNATVDVTIGAVEEALSTQVYLSKTKSPIRFAETTRWTNIEFAADSAKVYFEKDGKIVSFQPSWAEYNGVEVLADGKIDTTLIDVADGEAFELRFYADGKIYNATNVKMYDGIFVNTPESRLAFVDLLSAKAVNAHIGDENWCGETVTGTYLILEDIYFESNEIITNNDELESNGLKTYTTFSATLDGLGHTLHNVTLDSRYTTGTMFGFVGANAVIKNLAINGTRFGETYTTNRGRLFASVEEGNSLTLENFYFYSKFDAYDTFWAGIIWNSTGLKMTTRNVVIDFDFQGTVDGYRGAFNYSGAVDAESQAENTYLISSVKTTSSGSASLPESFKVYASKQAMIDAKNDYSTFDSAMWGIGQDGLPVFRGLFITALATKANGDAVESINAVGDYTVSVVDGYNNLLPTTLEVDNANVTINGTTVTVGAGYYTATLTVKDESGAIVRTYAISIDTREAEENNEEIIATKKGAIIVKGTKLEDLGINSVKYNGNEIYTPGEAVSNFADSGLINTSAFVYGEDGISLSGNLIVETTSKLYALTNVKVYADAYENTKASRESMVAEFSNNATAKARAAGYYILLESIEFDTTNPLEVFANTETDCRVFNDTFDGRGYAMTNIMIANTSYSIFGDWGANAVIKNVAFNNFYLAKLYGTIRIDGLYRQATKGLLFYDAEAVNSVLTLDNVYLYVEYETGATYSSTIAYGTANTGSITSNNLFIHIVDNTANGNIGTYHSTVYTATVARTATNSFAINPAERDNGPLGTRYLTVDAMKAANPDLTAFEESDMWAVVDGLPVFRCFVVTALATNEQGEEVQTLNAVGNYTVSVVDGYNNPLATQLEVDSANVTIDGTTVTVGEGYYTATLTVKDGEGKVIRTYTISIDTRVAEENNEEIIATKKGAIIVKGTKLEGSEISSVRYNGNEIYTPGEAVTNFADSGLINTSAFVYGGDGISLTGNLVVTTNTKIYALTNVKVYADAYENTTASRERMAAEFSKDTTREAGYYILLENIVFDTTNVNEVFVNNSTSNDAICRVFNDTLDGRGYSMTNSMVRKGYESMFGDWGENAVIKNIAFNNFYHATISGSSITTLTRDISRGWLFYDNATDTSELTLDNVYVYVEYEKTGDSAGSTLLWGKATSIVKMNNVFVHVVNNVEGGNIGTYAKTIYMAIKATSTNVYEVTTTKASSGITHFASIDAMKTANPDLTGFDESDMWAVVDGLPVFKCFVVTALATNEQGEEVKEINQTGVYTVSVVDGNNNPLATQLEVDSANVTIDGTTVTVGEGYYTATLTVKDGEGKVIRTYTISVDTRTLEENNEEIIATKKGAIIVKGTKLEGSEISSVKYDGNEIYTAGDAVTNFADSGSINVANFVYGGDGISLTGNLVVTTNTNIYALTNVKVYADAYENTTASRERMAAEFSNNATAKAREAGYYILLENIVFDTTNVNEIFTNSDADYRVFSDTFDGCGYSMTDIMISSNGYSVFGDWGVNAVIKNVAFNNFYVAKPYGTMSITSITRQATRGLLFYDNATAESLLTLDNVYLYVEYEARADYSTTLVWGSATGAINLNNVFIYAVDNVADNDIGDYHKTIYIQGTTTATNTYVVNPALRDSSTGWTGRYATIDAMKAANPDLTAFDESDMWAVVDGLPVFKCFVITALATNAQGEEVTEITETGVYTVSVVDGNNTPKATQLEVDSANVTIDGTTVTVGEGYYTATLTVKDGEGKVIRTYTISVDTRVPEENNEEIIATKKGALIVKDTALEGLEITSVKYDGNEIYTPGDAVTNFADSGSINVANLVYGDDGVSLSGNLVVATNTKIYALTNVKVYTEAYENTKASRESMVAEFSNNATAKAREAGYYTLLENIEFDTTNINEVFANTETDCRVFNDTLDGRGYAMTNTMISNTSYSVFGNWGANAVIKNIAFNNFYLAKPYLGKIGDLYRMPTRGLLFYINAEDNAELKLNDVYVYVEYEYTVGSSSTIAWGSATGKVTSNNLFVYIVDNTTTGNIGTYHSTVYTAGTTRTGTNSYAINPAERDQAPLGTRYTSVDAFKAANLDLTSYNNSDMWTVVDGLPVWNSLQG